MCILHALPFWWDAGRDRFLLVCFWGAILQMHFYPAQGSYLTNDWNRLSLSYMYMYISSCMYILCTYVYIPICIHCLQCQNFTYSSPLVSQSSTKRTCNIIQERHVYKPLRNVLEITSDGINFRPHLRRAWIRSLRYVNVIHITKLPLYPRSYWTSIFL